MTASLTLPRLRLARFRDLALVPAIVVLVVVGALIDPVFLSQAHPVNVLQQQTELSLLVLAETIILVTGKFDLSLESTIGLVPALVLGLVIPAASNGLGMQWPTAPAITLCPAVGLQVGGFSTKRRVAPDLTGPVPHFCVGWATC